MQASVNFAVGQVTGMIEFVTADIKVAVEEKLRTALNETGVILPRLDDCFCISTHLMGLCLNICKLNSTRTISISW